MRKRALRPVSGFVVEKKGITDKAVRQPSIAFVVAGCPHPCTTLRSLIDKFQVFECAEVRETWEERTPKSIH